RLVCARRLERPGINRRTAVARSRKILPGSAWRERQLCADGEGKLGHPVKGEWCRFSAASSHRCAEHPGREFSAAKIKTLALGRLSRGGPEHQLENALAALLHGLFAVEDGAAIDV